MVTRRVLMEAQASPTGPDYTENETLTVSSTSVGFDPAKIAEHISAFITVEDAAVRFWPNGVPPTATVGMELGTGDTLKLDSRHQLINVHFIRRDGVDATLQIIYGS